MIFNRIPAVRERGWKVIDAAAYAETCQRAANALLPGGTDTPMAQEMNGTPEALAQVARLHALRRIAQPEEIARAALFLASTAASFVTGSALLVGRSACMLPHPSTRKAIWICPAQGFSPSGPRCRRTTQVSPAASTRW